MSNRLNKDQETVHDMTENQYILVSDLNRVRTVMDILRTMMSGHILTDDSIIRHEQFVLVYRLLLIWSIELHYAVSVEMHHDEPDEKEELYGHDEIDDLIDRLNAYSDRVRKAREWANKPFKTQMTIRMEGVKAIFCAQNPAIYNCMAEGNTEQDARKNLAEVRQEIFENLLLGNLPLPEPDGT